MGRERSMGFYSKLTAHSSQLAALRTGRFVRRVLEIGDMIAIAILWTASTTLPNASELRSTSSHPISAHKAALRPCFARSRST